MDADFTKTVTSPFGDIVVGLDFADENYCHPFVTGPTVQFDGVSYTLELETTPVSMVSDPEHWRRFFVERTLVLRNKAEPELTVSVDTHRDTAEAYAHSEIHPRVAEIEALAVKFVNAGLEQDPFFFDRLNGAVREVESYELRRRAHILKEQADILESDATQVMRM